MTGSAAVAAMAALRALIARQRPSDSSAVDEQELPATRGVEPARGG